MRALLVSLGVCWLVGSASMAGAQNGRAQRAFGAGEVLTYDVKYGPLTVGSGRMEVVGVESVGGRGAWHVRLELRAGIPGFRVVNVLESWIDTLTLSSLRYRQETQQGGKNERREVEIIPERGMYRETDWRQRKEGMQEVRKPEAETVDAPLDQASFLYFARTQPLDVGQTYTFARYYKPANNPVTLTVLRREVAKVPAGDFPSIVVRPIFKSNGIFGQNGRAEVWFTDDTRRLMVRMETQLAFGSVTLLLKEFQGGGN